MRRNSVLIAVVGLCLGTLVGSSRLVHAEDAAWLVAPQELHTGGQSAFTVTTFDRDTKAPIAQPLAVTLRRGEALVATLFSGATGELGRVHVRFDVPEVESGAYAIHASVGGIAEPLVANVSISGAPAILVETDKPIYKPGQTIQGRVILVDNALRPTSGDVELAIHDAKGIRIDRQQLSAGEFGAAQFTLPLASEVNFGVWKLKASSEGVESIRDVRVEPYVLPRFELGASFEQDGNERDWALVDESITGTVSARYFFGRDVDGEATIVAKRWIGDWEEYARSIGSLSDGTFEFTLPPVEFVAGSPQDGGQGSVTLDVEVIDSTGHRQTTTEVLRITQAPLVLGLVPRTSSLKPEIPFDVLVTSRTPDGDGRAARVRVSARYMTSWQEPLGEESHSVDTADSGLGTITFRPPERTHYAELRATSTVDGREAAAYVELTSSYSASSSYISIARADGDGSVSVGENLSYTVTATHPGTVYYEVYAGGRTVFSADSETDEFTFAVTPEMAPRARVVAYKINPNNEISADSATFDVDIVGSLQISAQFDQETVRPGEAVNVTIDAGTGERTLLGVAVVDQSVLALGRSRLHLEQVFDELERRFLEPQAEVHAGGGHGEEPIGGGPAPGLVDGDFFGPGIPTAPGPRDILEDAGLVMVVSEGIQLHAGLNPNDFVDFDAAGPPEAGVEDGGGDGGDAGGTDPSGAIRVRQYFPETWVWEPLLLTDENGLTSLELTAPDSITGWRLSAVGTSASGIGFGETELKVFQEFFVEPSLPYSVTRGEEFPIKVDVFNYLDEPQEVSISLGASDQFDLLGASDAQVTVPANAATSLEFPIRPTALGSPDVELTAIASAAADAIRRPLTVVPEGVPTETVVNDVIEAGTSISLDGRIPDIAVSGSGRVFLHVTPSPVAQTMAGISDLLQMPYGCGEQNMIFLAPDVEILKYLREIGELSTEIRAQAEHFVNVGYQRELTYQTDDGGFAAFGGENGSLWLTAFVLSTFSSAREVRDIDETVLGQSADMLLSRQKDDGSFQTDSFLIHQEMDGGLENQYAMAAYVANALADYREGTAVSDAVVQGLGRAAGFLRDAKSDVWNDAYSLSIAAVALQKIDGFTAVADEVVDRLLELAIDEGTGIHWEPYPVETTGYAAMALLSANDGVGHPQAGEAVDWLSTTRNSLGGYGESTQDTVVAIKALFLAARKVSRDLEVTLRLFENDNELWSVAIDASNFDILHSFRVPSAVPGELELRSEGTGSVGYQLAKRFNIPGEELPPSRDMSITVDYRTDHVEVDDILDVHVRLLYSGAKESTGMVIADIGVPTGFDVLRPSLDALIEAEIASRIDEAGRKVIVYLDSLASGEPVEFEFQMRALYPVRAVGPVSQVYEYYDTELTGHHRMGQVEILERIVEPVDFVRSDANRDGNTDLSDAVTTLNFLFAGSSIDCLDAADSNDDGTLNITDPIYLLQFLFLGGTSPLPPYPDAGRDATPDDLDCRR